jgi:hypothetical protein
MINIAHLKWHCQREQTLKEIAEVLLRITWECVCGGGDCNTFLVWKYPPLRGRTPTSKGIFTPGILTVATIHGENFQVLQNKIARNSSLSNGPYFVRRKNTLWKEGQPYLMDHEQDLHFGVITKKSND